MINIKNVFLFDAVGAVLSAILTGLVLPYYFEVTGLRAETLYGLVFFPIVYAIYSLSCYFFVQQTKAWMLRTIISANLFYGFVSAGIIFFYDGLTSWGQVTLATELLIVLAVAKIEMKVYKKTFTAR